MNLYLHGIQSDPSPIEVGVDSLARDPKERFSIVLTNPPFGRKSTIGVGSSVEASEHNDRTYQRKDFWVATKNKQLSFLQHARTLIGERGRCAIVVPDNVLFEGGAGETIRRALLRHCNVHTLLRLPTGIFYAQGVKANVLFFDAKPLQRNPATKQLWIYDLRTDMRFTLRTRPLKQTDLAEFISCYQAAPRHQCAASWDAQKNPGGRWRSFEIAELMAREKANLDIFWLKEAGMNRSSGDVTANELAQGIVEELQSALNQFQSVANRLLRGDESQ